MRIGIRKLVLTKETLRTVTEPELGKVQGGISVYNPAYGAGSGCAWSHGSAWFYGGGGPGGSCVE